MELLYGPYSGEKAVHPQWIVPPLKQPLHQSRARMKPDSHDLNDLMYFSYVVEHGGFSAAERVLGISKSRLSRRVSELETSLGVRLMQRSTRKLALT